MLLHGNGRQQTVALHTQRACLVNGVRAALDAVDQACGNHHAGHPDEGREQDDEGQLIHQREWCKQTSKHCALQLLTEGSPASGVIFDYRLEYTHTPKELLLYFHNSKGAGGRGVAT